MNDLQLYLAVGLPTIAVLASLTVSLIQISGLREDMREIRTDVRHLYGQVSDLRSDITEIRGEMRDLRNQVGDLRSQMTDLRNDMKLIIAKLVELDNRVAH